VSGVDAAGSGTGNGSYGRRQTFIFRPTNAKDDP
jgi:hypothetical protein